MAFNYMNTGAPGRYPYHMPMHLIQQMDLSAMHVPPSNADLSNLMGPGNVAHCNSVSQQVIPPQVDLNSGVNNPRGVISDFSSIHRPAPELGIPSINSATDHLSVQGVRSQYSPSFQPYPTDQCLNLSESCHLNQPKHIPHQNITRGPLDTEQAHKIPKKAPVIPDTAPRPQKSKKPTKGDKDKKYKRLRYVKPGCSCTCQRRCKQKISQESREELFNEYWNLKNDNEKKYFIAHHAIKMPMMKCTEGSRRTFSVDWAFTIKGESFSVCKLFFLDTLDISEEMAYTAIKASPFPSVDANVPKKKKAQKKKATWFETDIDDYTDKRAKENSKRKPRYETKKEYITELRPGCTDICRKNCHENFTHEDRLFIFNGYRSLSNVRQQREYILAHVKRLERKYVQPNVVTRRGCSFKWLLPLRGEKVQVCKKFFLHTVGISEHTAYSVGLQSELQPVEIQKASKKDKRPSWSTMKSKYLKALIASGRLKSTLKIRTFRSKKFQDSATAEKGKKNTNETEASKIVSESIGTQDAPSPFPQTSDAMLPSASSSHSHFQQNPGLPAQPSNELHFGQHTGGLGNDLSTSSFNQPLDLGYGSYSTGGYFQQQPSLPHCALAHPQGNQHNPACAVTNDPLMSHDALLLQTLKNTTGDLFPSDANKAVKGRKRKSNLSPDMKKMKKPRRRDREAKPFNKRVKQGCSETCWKKCNEKIPQSVRQELFNEFWQLESDTGRREFILPIVNKVPKKSNKLGKSRRGCTIEWTVPYNGEFHVVCKKFFLDTFDITENFVKTVHVKMERNDGSMEDMRGRHGKRSAAFVKEEVEIENFIKAMSTFKAVRCLKCEKDFPRWCLENRHPLIKLYKDYSDARKLHGIKPACRGSFTAICAKKFNIRQNTPEDNVCEMCMSLSFPATDMKASTSASVG